MLRPWTLRFWAEVLGGSLETSPVALKSVSWVRGSYGRDAWLLFQDLVRSRLVGSSIVRALTVGGSALRRTKELIHVIKMFRPDGTPSRRTHPPARET